MKWIKVSEKMPNEDVFLVYDGDYITIGQMYNGKIFSLEFIEIEDATHWMHLPKPPEKD
jgi:hypothetical protein